MHRSEKISPAGFLRLIVVIVLLLSLPIWFYGQDLPTRPSPPKLVVDYAGVLNPSERAALERKLVRFNDTTSNQILIVITDNLMGNTIEEYASSARSFTAKELYDLVMDKKPFLEIYECSECSGGDTAVINHLIRGKGLSKCKSLR